MSASSHWFSLLEVGKEVCGIFFDYRKAFDSVPHRPLLDKLAVLNIHPHLVQWISNCLTSRIQHVLVEGKMSVAAPVHSGVPQGSVLGLLFLIYIDGIITISLSHETC